MKLFLSSEAISYEQGPAFMKLVGKPAKEIKIALIENAADIEKGDTSWVDENRTLIQALGCQIERIDLNDYKNDTRKEPLANVLRRNDVIWLGGGNTYYLRWLLRETRADVIIKELVGRGKVYGGGSAGAIVAGPTLKFFEPADDPSAAPKLILEGLGLTDIVVVPHWDDKKYGPIVKKSAKKLIQAGYKTQHITEAQALVINGDHQTIVS